MAVPTQEAECWYIALGCCCRKVLLSFPKEGLLVLQDEFQVEILSDLPLCVWLSELMEYSHSWCSCHSITSFRKEVEGCRTVGVTVKMSQLFTLLYKRLSSVALLALNSSRMVLKCFFSHYKYLSFQFWELKLIDVQKVFANTIENTLSVFTFSKNLRRL